MTITVLGADGFVGSHVIRRLERSSIAYRAVRKGESVGGDLGDVIDCVGVTSDFRHRPYDAMNAHVGRVSELIRFTRFDSFLYLSSSRVYRRALNGHEECPIPVVSSEPDDLYAISKLAGEAICLRNDNPAIRVARLSNVYGIDTRGSTFLSSVIPSAIVDRRVDLSIHERSARDFVSVDDVVTLLLRIASSGRHRLYNVASGTNVLTGKLVRDVCRLAEAAFSAHEGPLITFPRVSIERTSEEFNISPSLLSEDLPALIDGYRRELVP